MLAALSLLLFDVQFRYKTESQIVAMNNLLNAYTNGDIKEFEKILTVHQSTLLADEFMKMYIEDLLRIVRTQVLLKMLSPYTRIHIPFISKVSFISYCETVVDSVLSGTKRIICR